MDPPLSVLARFPSEAFQSQGKRSKKFVFSYSSTNYPMYDKPFPSCRSVVVELVVVVVAPVLPP